MEFVIGALSAIGAGVFTNPLEVVKTRFQLQGELRKRGNYSVHYRNFIHAGYVIAKVDGITALQKGLVPALCHQWAEDRNLHLKENGEISLAKSMAIGGVMGAIGSFTGSPLYLVKTRLQAQSDNRIAVGHQHHVAGLRHALITAYHQEGIRGLWRGVGGSIPRMVVGSSSQLGTFFICREFLEKNEHFRIERGLLNTFLASMMGGVVVAITMGPLDVISTRLYNQGVDCHGKGLLYSSYMDCVKKMWYTEGFQGFYKGIIPCYMRIGPHTVLCMVFWDQLKQLQSKFMPR
ncbi:hypothetical protein AAG570_009902 [Ranatra chinensis]|uniref:Solute carrier family 25 member 35 n=1 Tax=Ranatra chinensis TaxID=642074 RepID=A0ABD0YQG0_9HEMI